jgi:hypothetical protein
VYFWVYWTFGCQCTFGCKDIWVLVYFWVHWTFGCQCTFGCIGYLGVSVLLGILDIWVSVYFWCNWHSQHSTTQTCCSLHEQWNTNISVLSTMKPQYLYIRSSSWLVVNTFRSSPHSWLHIHDPVCNYNKTTGATSGAGTDYPSGATELTPVFSGVRVTRS